MRLPPLAVVASWPTPNYIDPVTRGPGILIVNIILVTLVTIAVGGRLYSRIFVKRWFGIDDAMIIPAFALDVGLTAVVLLANLKYDWNRHVYDLPPNLIPPAQKVAFSAKILFTLAATFIRLSLICFYYRLVKTSGLRWFYRVLHLSVAWTMAVCVTFIVLTIWLCSPIQAYWTLPPIGHCMSEGKAMLGGGIVNSVTDLWVTILPIPIVMRLQMPLKQRIGVCVLLCMGVVATAAGSVRTYYTWKSLLQSWDETWWAYWLWVAAAIEIHVGMICACAPAWKSLLQEPFKSLSSRISSKISSLRQRTHTPESSSAAKPTSFNPLRSLPWFLHTRFDFEKTQLDPDGRKLKQLEKELDQYKGPEHRAFTEDRNENDSEQPEKVSVAEGPVEDALCITMRQSIDQSSTRLGESPVVPDGWIREGGSTGTLMRR